MVARVFASLQLVLFAFALLPDCAAAEPQTEIEKQLKAYYSDLKLEPPWKNAIDTLRAGTPEAGAKAARYLVALLTQALDDERAAAPPEEFTPWRRRYSQNPAYFLHRAIADELATWPGSLAALPVVRWFLDNAPDPRQPASILGGIDKLDGKEMDDFRISLLCPPHRNAAVVVAAMQQLGRRKVTVPSDKLLPLCQHYRNSIRDEARRLNAQQMGPEPKPFDPVQAMKSEPMAALMERIRKTIVEPPPADAQWVGIANNKFHAINRRHMGLDGGWLVKDGADRFVVLSASGWKETFSKSPKEVEGATMPGPAEFSAEKIEKAVADLNEHRRTLDKQYEPELQRGVYSRFEVNSAGLEEVLVGEWLCRTKRYDLAAQVIFPAIDCAHLDDFLVDIVRYRLSENYSYLMLSAFAGKRDYELALKLAQLVRERFPGTEFHKYAAGLADQLPKRRDDFKKLKLPTAKEWADIKAKMSRVEQIDYLCQRLRLLNCFQYSQPGGVDYSEGQCAEPGFMTRNAAWGGPSGKTKVINPLVELAGGVHGEVEPGAKISGGLGLTVADIPTLAPHLRDDWYMPTVSFFRDMASCRQLHSVRPLLASIINNLAKRELVNAANFGKLTDADRTTAIDRIIQWTKENANKEIIDLNRDAVREGIKAGKPWRQVAHNVETLAKVQSPEALPALLHYLDEKSTYGIDKRGILRNCRKVDAKAAKEQARRSLGDKDIGVQAQAAITLLKAGETKAALTALVKVMESATRTDTGGVDVSEYMLFSDDFQDVLEELLVLAPDDLLIKSLSKIREAKPDQLQPLKKWLVERMGATNAKKQED
jgi:hypothetical protein